MLSDRIREVDFMILDWIREHLTSSTLDGIVPKVSFLGNAGWFFIFVAIIFLITKKYRKWGLSLIVSFCLGGLFGNMIIKNAVSRTRPYDLVEGINLLVDKLKDYSFPSGHTMIAFEFFAVILLMPIAKIYKVLAGILAVSIAFSRLYLYVHFPSDVLVGAILGSLFGVMGVRIVTMIAEERKNKKKIEQE